MQFQCMIRSQWEPLLIGLNYLNVLYMYFFGFINKVVLKVKGEEFLCIS